MSASFVAYIDESGDEGFKFSKGSSEWFVLSAAITRKRFDLATVKLVDDVRTLLKCHPEKVLHFRDLKHEHRIAYVDTIAKAPLRAASVLVHKPSLLEPEVFQEKHRFYRYVVRYLLERVSWFCRDNHDPARFGGDGSADIVFSNRSSMSYEMIREYLQWLKLNSERFSCTIDWSAIKVDQIAPRVPSQRMGLLIADAIASSAYFGVNPSQVGFTEPRYITDLKPIIYRRAGRYIGYGLKSWPKEVQHLIDASPNLKWVKDGF
jgi:hypothetical protein